VSPEEQFGINLADARERRGLSQSQLARKVDVVDSYISRLETGRATPSFSLIVRLAAELGTTPSELFADVR
jgi:transcriptional regulator with XRE-family HTH domain